MSAGAAPNPTPSNRLSSSRLDAAWSDFWFAPTSATIITRVRVAVCLVTALWLVSFWDGIDTWFGPAGLLSSSMSAQFVEFEETSRWQHWSPLWLTDYPAAYQAYVVGGIVLSLVAACGIGGRLSVAALTLVCISWIHRITWIQGVVEPAMVAMLGYLIVAPGNRLFVQSTQATEPHWLNNLAVRLIQVHWWMLVAAGLLMQLGGLVWWRGEAVWWLASSGHSYLLSIDMLRNSPTLVNGLTHGMILVQALSLWLLVVPPAHKIGMCFGLVATACIGLVADQVLYAMLLASCLLAWLPPKREA